MADEATPWTEALLDRVAGGEEVVAPAHWPLEIVNGLPIAQRRGRVTDVQISELVADPAALSIHVVPAPGPSQRRAILHVAQHTALPFATLDDALRKAAMAAGIALVELTL